MAQTNEQESETKIPLWIVLYAGLQALTAVVGIYGGYIDPSFFYTQFPDANFADPLILHLAAVWGSKNLATVLVMLYSIVRKRPQMLATVLLLKFIADTVDILLRNKMVNGEF